MNALLKNEGIAATKGPSFWVVITDESGPLDAYITAGDWRHYSPEVLEQLVKAAHPGLTVTSAKWAEHPRHYTISDDVLLVSIPGTHVLPPKFVSKRKRAERREPKRDHLHATAADVADRFTDDWRSDPGMRGVVARESVQCATFSPGSIPGDVRARMDADRAAAVEAGPTCCCGIERTLTAYRELPLIAAGETQEGFTKLHRETRTCTCGAVLPFTRARLVAG